MAAEAAALLTEEDQAQDVSGLEVNIQEMRDRLERMGPVNILAVEQSQEFEERHTFLTAQRQDLLDSISELDQAIKKIDRTSKERFREAFDVINQHFGDIFRQLFGGGAAGLTLLDEDDLLESGIDVMAQPPGKRLQSVMLLSGGEKALTAISLLFAIFQYKPSPFCILDEVDAPLDDANIGRFVRMLDGLKEQTQFVLITHSRKTMEIADQLYGVTMEEPGVSKLVSVRFS
jgi:chromosome segregation protein